jgi:serine/alanine adding enzyme
MELNLIKGSDCIDRDKWNRLLAESEFASPFQTPAHADLINSVKEYSAEVYAVESGGTLKALCVADLQKQSGAQAYFSRRAIIYGGPVLSKRCHKELKALLEFINRDLTGKSIFIETRNFFDYSLYKTVFEDAGWTYVPWLNFQLQVDSEDMVLRNMSASRRRQIRQAVKSGAYWEEARSLDDVRKFYSLLIDLYKNKIKKPLHPWDFFKNYYTTKSGLYLLVYFKEKVIGGILCPVLPDETIYEFYVCGLDREYKNQHPSVMATWAAIEYALINKIGVFDFMGAGSRDESYGVREFKSRFGGQEVEHGRYNKIINPYLYHLGKTALKVKAKIG